MARAKSNSKKATKSTRSISKKSFNLSNWVRTNRMWLFILVFAVIGTYYLVSTYAIPKLPTYSDDIVAGYINLTPTVLEKDKSGNLTYEMYPSTVYVQVDGTLVCDSGGSSGTVKTGTLSKGQVKSLHKDMYGTGVTDLADEIGFGPDDAFASYEGILVGGETDAKGTAVYGDAEKPDSFEKAKNKLTKMCEQATRTAEREDIDSPREPKLKKTGNKKTAFTLINDFIFQEASACCNGGTEDKAFEYAHYTAINQWRTGNGRAALPHGSCMGDKATYWADKMAVAGKISHSPSLGADTAACHPNWRKAGENVGVGWDNAGLMKAFKESPSHNTNMLDPAWKVIGVGAVKKADKRIFVVQRYAAY